MDRPYLTFSDKRPSAASLLLKVASDKNAAMLREKTVEEHRELQQKLAALRPFPPNLSEQEVLCAGVPCSWIQLKEPPEDGVVLYLHGGSWAFGNRKTAKSMASLMAESTRLHVLTVDYRLAPEHPFPAGLDDCLSVYRWLLARGISPAKVAFLGDSAGGNLCLALFHRLQSEGLAPPACICLASPVTDLREDRSVLVQSDCDLIYTQYEGAETDIFRLYLGAEQNRENPLLSPIEGDLSTLPPTLIHVGGDEPLSLDNQSFAQKAWESGAPVHLKVWHEMFHDFTVVGITLRESRHSIRELSDFILRHVCEPDASRL